MAISFWLKKRLVEAFGDFGKKFYFSQISTNSIPFDSASNGDSESEFFFEKFSPPETIGLVFLKTVF